MTKETRGNEVPPEAVVTYEQVYVGSPAYVAHAVGEPSLEVVMVHWLDEPAKLFASMEEAEDYIGAKQAEWLDVRRCKRVLDRAPADLARCTKVLERIAKALPEGDLREHFTVTAFQCADGIEMLKKEVR